MINLFCSDCVRLLQKYLVFPLRTEFILFSMKYIFEIEFIFENIIDEESGTRNTSKTDKEITPFCDINLFIMLFIL